MSDQELDLLERALVQTGIVDAIRLERESRKTQVDRAAERKELLGSHLAFTRKFIVEKGR
ncbi:MAG TPA: hypothetical protein VNS34_12710 [Rhizobiaceae bacterium]|nr:hypothetical protein [Rhizobiaceae bacterium]